MPGADADELLARAQTLLSRGRADAARRVLRRGVDLPVPSDHYWFALAALLVKAALHREAIFAVGRASSLRPEEPKYCLAMAQLLRGRGELEAAEQAYRRALAIRPDYADAWIGLGVLLRSTARPAQAEVCQREALRTDPTSVEAMVNLGNALEDLGSRPEAAQWFQRAVEIDPNCAEAQNNLGRLFLRDGDYTSASLCFHKAFGARPGYFEAAQGLGQSLLGLRAFADAIPVLERAVALRPDELEAGMMLATAYFETRAPRRAAQVLEKLVKTHPEIAKARADLATVLLELGQHERARGLYEQAVALAPDDHHLRGNFAFLLLREGDFERAWEYYESRWYMPDHPTYTQRNFTQPRWAGEPLGGKSLAITCEQGLGDEIMFASVLPEVIAEARSCVIECDARLEKLFQRSFPRSTVFGVPRSEAGWNELLAQRLQDQELPPVDCWTPARSLPRFRRRRQEDFALAPAGYLVADQAAVQRWKARLESLGGGLKVGVGWRGGTYRDTAKRSLSLQELAPILTIPGIQFISLQYTDCREEIANFAAESGVTIHHWQAAIDDYDETAALVKAVDLVVSVCSSVIHLGGALDARVWVMAPYIPEWRYGRAGPTMPWYRSVSLFRQPSPGRWGPVVQEVRQRMRERVAGR